MTDHDKTHVSATFYLQVEPIWGGSYGGNRLLRGAKASRLSQNRPGRPLGGTVLVKLSVLVPRAAFLPLRPEAVIVIPEDMTEVQPVHVEALAPGDQ